GRLLEDVALAVPLHDLELAAVELEALVEVLDEAVDGLGDDLRALVGDLGVGDLGQGVEHAVGEAAHPDRHHDLVGGDAPAGRPSVAAGELRARRGVRVAGDLGGTAARHLGRTGVGTALRVRPARSARTAAGAACGAAEGSVGCAERGV